LEGEKEKKNVREFRGSLKDFERRDTRKLQQAFDLSDYRVSGGFGEFGGND
jgi:hypothetical protein